MAKTSRDIAKALGARHAREGVRIVPKTPALALIKDKLREAHFDMGSRRLFPHEGTSLWDAYTGGYFAARDSCAECKRGDDSPHADSCSLGMAFDAADRGHKIKYGSCVQCYTGLAEIDYATSCPAGISPDDVHDPNHRRTQSAHA